MSNTKSVKSLLPARIEIEIEMITVPLNEGNCGALQCGTASLQKRKMEKKMIWWSPVKQLCKNFALFSLKQQRFFTNLS